jgi:hypothetical protein
MGGVMQMRMPCAACGCEEGYITPTNGQNCVRCSDCDRWQYNAPKVETGEARRSIQTTHAAIKPSQRIRIIERAHGRCELCGARSFLHVGHIVSVQDGHSLGLTDAQINSDDNLIAECEECNLGHGKDSIPAWLVGAVLKARSTG